jgi:protease-4
MQFELGTTGISSQTFLNDKQEYGYQTYGIRVGAYDRTIMTRFQKDKALYAVNMGTGLDYTRFKLFDERTTLFELLNNIEAAKDDQRVSGIVINGSILNGNPELYWEVREKLKDFKKSGKKVTVYLERADLADYHFASVADRIVMDPLGQVEMSGYLMGRGFLKGTLEKLGIGFDEFRFFKYKSAMEPFSREKMSEADREQRQKIVDDWYALAKKDITEGRNFTGDKFDSLINQKVIMLSDECLAIGLVDTLARWSEFADTLKKEKQFLSGKQLEANILPDDNRWGEKPTIAVIYALGACDMETGIAARHLVKDVKAAVDNDDVKAIVLRVDSPGGDALASDYIAAELKRAKGKKPVYVTQGFVAGSGGYWLSMYGDTIIGAPSTITGSIGVIGGWFYNKSFKEMLGASTDFVKRGDHADLGFGFVIPFIGFSIPDRAPSVEERAKVEFLIRDMYKYFVQKVADGRKKKFEDIEPIAQGRVWSGYDGLKLGLLDQLGGLETAIKMAEEKTHLQAGEYNIAEYPAQKLIDFNIFMPKLIGVNSITQDPTVEKLKYRIQNNGKPLYMVPLDFDIEP